MNRSYIYLSAVLPLSALLAACGAGEPATAEHVEDLIREDAVEDGYEVSWVHAEPEEEAGHFRTFVDRTKPDEEGSDETWICNVQATTMSNSWTCQTMTPSLITQAVAMLEEQYTALAMTRAWALPAISCCASRRAATAFECLAPDRRMARASRSIVTRKARSSCPPRQCYRLSDSRNGRFSTLPIPRRSDSTLMRSALA